MNLNELEQSGRIMFSCTSGSIAYGTNLPTSDHDTRGIYINPKEDYLGINSPAAQINDDKQDIIYYSLKRFFELAQSANPNIIELMWIPEDCIKKASDQYKELIANRNLFLSTKCWETHSGYAYAQIKKSRGQNKRVHNPQPEERPKKEDFCFILTTEVVGQRFPGRPTPLKDTSIDLNKYHASSVEHIGNLFRLYHYGDSAKGIFRGDDNLCMDSIPMEDEHGRFSCLLLYNKSEYERSVKEWSQYWEWKKNRNDARWVDQENKSVDFDQKNMLHCMRLLLSGHSLLTKGEPIVRFEGEQRDYLMAIRQNKLVFEDILSEAERLMDECHKIVDEKKSVLPTSVNIAQLDSLYRSIS